MISGYIINMKIVIGIPTLNRADLLQENLVDLAKNCSDVTQIIIIDNGNQNIQVPEKIKKIVTIIIPGKNLGVAASWNRILDEAFNKFGVEDVLILNDDIVLGYSLKSLNKIIATHQEYFLVVGGYYWSSFFVSKKGYETVGKFDENFYPAYYEDNDYNYRLFLLNGNGVKRGFYLKNFVPKVRRNSMTLKKDQTINNKFNNNKKYYIKKWGGKPHQEKYKYPFNQKPVTKRVLAILTVYNEIKYLPLKVAWCKKNNLDLYVIDNMSNDGTWEYLQKNKIKSHRVNTNESFDLIALQKEIVKTLHKEKPDWVVYNGADLFFQTDGPKTLYEHIISADTEGINLLEMSCIYMYNTGEDTSKFNPFNTYFYYRPFMTITMIHKYHKDVHYHADRVDVPNPKKKRLPGVIINFGQAKTLEEREDTFKRRKKAWDSGKLHKDLGGHYREGKILNWVWEKNSLIDIRTSKFAKYFKELQT